MSDWIRHGECNGCGACCQVLAHPVTLRLTLPPIEAAYLVARGITQDADGTAGVTGALVAPCPQLTAETRCGIQATKPQYCQDFPMAPEQITAFPCSYWFERDGTWA